MTGALEAVLAAGAEQVVVTAGKVLEWALPAVMTGVCLFLGIRRLMRRGPLRVVRIGHAPADDDWEPGWPGDGIEQEIDDMVRRYGHG